MIELHEPAVEQEERRQDRGLVVCEKIVECFGRRRYTVNQFPAPSADSSLFGFCGVCRSVWCGRLPARKQKGKQKKNSESNVCERPHDAILRQQVREAEMRRSKLLRV